MFPALHEAGINIELITTSEIRITRLIDPEKVPQAVRAPHKAFELEGYGRIHPRPTDNDPRPATPTVLPSRGPYGPLPPGDEVRRDLQHFVLAQWRSALATVDLTKKRDEGVRSHTVDPDAAGLRDESVVAPVPLPNCPCQHGVVTCRSAPAVAKLEAEGRQDPCQPAEGVVFGPHVPVLRAHPLVGASADPPRRDQDVATLGLQISELPPVAEVQ